MRWRTRDRRFIEISADKAIKFIDWVISKFKLPLRRDDEHVDEEIWCCYLKGKVRAGWRAERGYLILVELKKGGYVLMGTRFKDDKRGHANLDTLFSREGCVIEDAPYADKILGFLVWVSLYPLIKQDDNCALDNGYMAFDDWQGDMVVVMERGKFVKGCDEKFMELVAQAKAKELYKNV